MSRWRVFRFTIRELALRTLAVAMSVAWWLDHREQVSQRQAITSWMLRFIPDGSSPAK